MVLSKRSLQPPVGVFRSHRIPGILKSDLKYLLIKDQPVTCFCCGMELESREVGVIAKGHTRVACSCRNASCIHYLMENFHE